MNGLNFHRTPNASVFELVRVWYSECELYLQLYCKAVSVNAQSYIYQRTWNP